MKPRTAAKQNLAVLALCCWLPLTACQKPHGEAENATPKPSAQTSSSSSIAAPESQPAPRPGMVWIAPGPLVAGTPPESLPRLADQEMPGEQVILKGFYIDTFEYPNEEGAIPLANVTQAAASDLCAQQGKRLCSELEWERACKGPDNFRYEYGDIYRADRCGTGAPPSMRPSGLRVSCRSGFGVRDLHGGMWEWTSSPWGRGTNTGLAALRGGNALAGELVGRCANAMAQKPAEGGASIGFRCCAGPPNSAEVVLHVARGEGLELHMRVDRELNKRLIAALPESAQKDLAGRGDPSIDRVWSWHPIGNEELITARVCAGIAVRPGCGILVARMQLDKPNVLAWASSGHLVGTLHPEFDPRQIWLLGGDDISQFKRLLAYEWGHVAVGPEERRLPSRKKKKKKRGAD